MYMSSNTSLGRKYSKKTATGRKRRSILANTKTKRRNLLRSYAGINPHGKRATKRTASSTPGV